jgi:biopolymer transport protein ExbB/TolQ
VTISPVVLTLLGLLVTAVSALLAGGVAWGRFSSALEALRADHAGLRADLKGVVSAISEVSLLRSHLHEARDEITRLRERAHAHASAIARLEERAERHPREQH